MTIEEIKQAFENGNLVKFQNSKNIVAISAKGQVYSQSTVTGAKKELTSEDLEDCFI